VERFVKDGLLERFLDLIWKRRSPGEGRRD